VRLLFCACLLTVGAVMSPLGTGAAAAAPTGAFTWAPTPVVAGSPVTFTATVASPEVPPLPLTTQWDLGGLGTCAAMDLTCTVTPPAAGAFVVTLTVSDGIESVQVRHAVTVVDPAPANLPPPADFAALPMSPLPGDEVTFIALGDDPDGTTTDWAWDLDGDGSFDDGDEKVVTHRFSTPGQKTIALQVTDNEGLSATNSLSLIVRQPGTPAPPTASNPVTTTTGGVTVGNVVATAPLPKLLSPFPVVTVGGSLRPTGTKIDLLAVRAPQGSRVSVRCRGKGCRLKPLSKVVGRGRLRVKAAERLMPAGVVLEVLVRRGDRIGKFTRLKLRDNKRPKRTDGCLWPGTAQLAPCPDS
jgi:hypothetical protein